jgi:putative transposase
MQHESPRDCRDNAVVESCFATLEHEMLTDADFPSREAACRTIFAFVEVWYNREREYSSLG